jgi:hypothetical protein
VSDAVSVLSLVISIAALGMAYGSYRRSGRAFKITEDEYRQRQRDREARPALGIEFRPTNQVLDDDGFIRTDAGLVYVNLAIRITNSGDKPASGTEVEVWVPVAAGAPTLKWVDASGTENDDLGKGARDLTTKLPSGDGRELDTVRITRTLEAVPLMGSTIHLRIPCPMQVPGKGMVAVRVRARTDGGEADETYQIRLLRPDDPG